MCAWRGVGGWGVVLQAACLLMGGAVFPSGLLFGLGLISPDGWDSRMTVPAEDMDIMATMWLKFF